jgi:hypothetical protein
VSKISFLPGRSAAAGAADGYKSLARRGLAALGFEIRRIRRSDQALVAEIVRRAANGPTLPFPLRKIEMVGAAGVGKTFFFDRLLRCRMASDGWLTPGEARQAGFTQHEADECLIQAYRDLLDRKLQAMRHKGYAFKNEMSAIGFHSDTLKDDMEIATQEACPPVLRSEGLLHGFADELIRQAAGSPELFNRISMDRVVIHCTAPADVVIERILKRSATGRSPRFWLDGLSRSDLDRKVCDVLEQRDILVDLLRARNVPVLRLDLSAPPEEVDEAFRGFLQELRGRERK